MKTNKEVLNYIERNKMQIELWCCVISQHFFLEVEDMLDYLFEKLKKHEEEFK